MPKRRRKIAILGTASSSAHLAPVGDPSWELWGLGYHHRQMPCARFIEIHGRDYVDERWPDYIDQLKGLDPSTPVYMQRVHDDIPASVEFPLAAVTAACGQDTPNFASSIAFSIGLAILERIGTIGIWGVDMAFDTEYAYERPNVDALLTWAKAKGIEIVVPAESALLKNDGLYGYEDPREGLVTRAALDKRIADYTRERDEKRHEATLLDGAIREARCIKAFLEHRKRGGSAQL